MGKVIYLTPAFVVSGPELEQLTSAIVRAVVG
jgi:hypothetical protein